MPTKLQLYDNGNGIVDVTQNDGIYSAIFPYVGSTPGFYSVQIIADDNEGQAVLPNDANDALIGPKCCGSKIDFKTTAPCPKFRRFASGSSFYVSYNVSKDVDMIPPSRIIDLRRTITPTFMTVAPSFDNGNYFTLEWSAPGNDFVYGKAYRYILQCFGKSSEEVHIDQNDLPTPEVYGTKQSVVLKIPELNKAFFYAIYAIDEAANAAKVSNIVSVFAYKPLFITSTTTTTTTTSTPMTSEVVVMPTLSPIRKRTRNRPTHRRNFFPSNYDSGSVIIPSNPMNSMVDVTNTIDMPFAGME